MPQDPASGAARSLNTICEMLAEAGFEVRALATTASERQNKSGASAYLQSLSIDLAIRRPDRSGPYRPQFVFHHRGIHYTLLDTADFSPSQWEKVYGRHFDLLFDQELRDFQPDLLLTYGGSAADVRRRQRARAAGASVVFGLRNLGYLVPGAFKHVDAILSTSQFVTSRYREAMGVESTPLPTPLDWDDVLAPERNPLFFTFVNPSPEKGLMFIARLLEESSVRRPDVPFLVVEARVSAGLLAGAAITGGFDLRRHENILVSAAVPKPRDLYAATRALLVPSVWEEPAGRVAPEALINGIPAMVSDRGGLSEMLHGGGFVLPIPAEVTPASKKPPPAAAVEPWLELVFQLADDENFYQQASVRARAAGQNYARKALAPLYVDFFEAVLRGTIQRPQ